MKVLVELFQKLAGGGRRPQHVKALIRFGFETIFSQGVALWRPFFTNKKRRRKPSFRLSDFRVRHQAHDCTEALIKRGAYHYRRFQGALRPLTRTTFEKVDETFNPMVMNMFQYRQPKVLVELFQKLAGGGRSPQEATVLICSTLDLCFSTVVRLMAHPKIR